MKANNICFMSLSFLPQIGGLVSYIKSFSNYLVQNGAEVQVFSTNSGETSLASVDIIDSVRVRRSDSRIKSYFIKAFTPFVMASRIRRHIRDNLSQISDAELIVVRHVYYAYALLGFKELEGRAIYLAPLLAHKLEMLNSKGAPWIRRCYGVLVSFQLYVMEWAVFRFFGHVAVLSDSKKNEIVSAYGLNTSRISVVPPGVDMDRFMPLREIESRERLITELDPEYAGEKIVLTVCRLVEEKNVSELVKAMSMIKSSAKLYVVGDGPQKRLIELLAAEIGIPVKFFGARNDVEKFYRIANCFVLASFYEGFGHVFLEALSSGCPVVGVKNSPPNSITASEEIIEVGRVGEISSSHQAADLACSINKILENSSVYCSSLCRVHVEERFSWRSHLKSLKVFAERKSAA
tara:strand:- start:2022 stop:3239 length:1218 start_codon:yes stop_codon:yes gene_type:complete